MDRYKTPYGDPLPFYELLRTYQDPLRKPPTLLRTVMDLLTAFTDPTRPLPPATYYTALHSMADISKQVSEGQKKWS